MTDAPARHSDKERNKIINQTSTDLEKIINGHDPENDTSLNNMVWDRLDKMAVEIEARLTAERDTLREFVERVADGHPKDYTNNFVIAQALLDKFPTHQKTAV